MKTEPKKENKADIQRNPAMSQGKYGLLPAVVLLNPVFLGCREDSSSTATSYLTSATASAALCDSSRGSARARRDSTHGALGRIIEEIEIGPCNDAGIIESEKLRAHLLKG
jgi:hypothetical protein